MKEFQMARPPRWLTSLILFMLLGACGGGQASAPSTTAVPSSAEAPTEAATAVATTAVAGGDLTVFAAASLTDAFDELGKMFEAAHSGTTVTFNFAGSQQLAQQIAQGAPVDVFAAANKKTMDTVIASGQVISGTQRTFVRNRLVVIYPKDNPAGLKTLEDLARPGLKLDLAAKEVPVGQYALDFLDKAVADPAFGASFKDGVLENVVSYEENVKAVLSKVTLGEADAGIVYTTDITLNAGDKVGRIDIPDALNTIASYPIAAIKDAPHADLAVEFVTFILSPDAQHVLAKYGFMPMTGSTSGAAPGTMPLAAAPVTLTANDFKKMKQIAMKARTVY
jgi:molybdate transport system substrate-binding protein